MQNTYGLYLENCSLLKAHTPIQQLFQSPWGCTLPTIIAAALRRISKQRDIATHPKPLEESAHSIGHFASIIFIMNLDFPNNTVTDSYILLLRFNVLQKLFINCDWLVSGHQRSCAVSHLLCLCGLISASCKRKLICQIKITFTFSFRGGHCQYESCPSICS